MNGELVVFKCLKKSLICFSVIVLIAINGFSQDDLSHLSDKELKRTYKSEIQKMERQGARFIDFYKQFVKKRNPLQYIVSREAYYRQKVFFIYSHEKMKAEKLLNEEQVEGEQTETDKDQEERKSSYLERLYSETYQDYLIRKQTKEAKTHWEDYINDSILKLVVVNLKALNLKEKEQQEELTNLLNKRSFMKSVLVTDGIQTKQIKRSENGELQEEIIVID